MKEAETITEYFSRVMMVANDMRNLGEDVPKVVEKILRTLVEKFTYVVCAIEESKDIKDMTIDGLQSSLMVHEQKLSRHVSNEQVLRVEGQWRSDEGKGRGGYQYQGRGRGGYQGCGRGSGSASKKTVECYKCHKLGHYRNECPEWEKKENYAELEEDVLLMAYIEMQKEEEEHVWFLDSGCSNYMCGIKEWFVDFDETFRQNVKLGDDRRMMVEGRGNLRLQINGTIQLISSVYYVLGLKSNLMSVGQLQQKGLRIIIEDDVCEIWHKQQRRLLMKSIMSRNRTFVVLAVVKGSRDTEEGCLQVTEEKVEDLWHKRLGHLSHVRMQSLVEKIMVNGLSELSHNEAGGVCDLCMRGKQNREKIPKKSSWRASRALQLVHTDVCGPIAPTSASGKRYVVNFIDDYSRKCWSFLLADKFEAMQAFKEFKAAAEREMGLNLVSLRSDRGGDFNSASFQEFCREHDIKQQLTAAYTPQQNGITERKNRSIMNMTRCMLLGMSVPRRFWPEAVQYAIHVLNRSPSAAFGDITLEEKWSSNKPLVEHMRVFGCVASALVPYERQLSLMRKASSACLLE